MWSRKSDSCLRCGTSAIRHGGKGLCMACYQKDWAAEKADDLKVYKHKWYENSKVRVDYREKSRRQKNGPFVDAVFARYGYKCSKCGSAENLQIHHKDHRGHNVPEKERNNSMSNLEVLCGKCHGHLHGSIAGWSRKHDKCRLCGRTDAKHHAHGYCVRCHWKAPCDKGS